jgi:tetratricopeptide (TPR) repeat protein
VTLVMVVLGLGLLWAVKMLGSTVAGRTRARGASRSQARRHFVNAAQLLAKSRSPGNAGAVGRKIAREAVAEADAAILLDPKDAALYIVKSLALQQLGRPAAALRSLTTALTKPASSSLSPSERAEALAKRASLFLEQGKGRRGLDLAIADLEESLSLKADNVDVQCMLASCYEKNGQKVKAVAAYQNSLALDPDFSEAKKGLSKVES